MGVGRKISFECYNFETFSYSLYFEFSLFKQKMSKAGYAKNVKNHFFKMKFPYCLNSYHMYKVSFTYHVILSCFYIISLINNSIKIESLSSQVSISDLYQRICVVFNHLRTYANSTLLWHAWQQKCVYLLILNNNFRMILTDNR